jgi:hypothetical protein
MPIDCAVSDVPATALASIFRQVSDADFDARDFAR